MMFGEGELPSILSDRRFSGKVIISWIDDISGFVKLEMHRLRSTFYTIVGDTACCRLRSRVERMHI